MSDPWASWVETVLYLMLIWDDPGCCEMDWMPVMEDSMAAGARAFHRIAPVHDLIGGPDSARETHDKDGCGQRRRQLDGTEPGPRVKHQALPEAALLRGFQRLLQAHARCCNQIRRRLLHGKLGERGVKLPAGFQFRSALRAARQVLFQFVTSVIGQLVIDVQQNVLSYPLAFHRMSANAPRSFWVARNKVFFAVSSVVFKISPTVRNFSPW